MPHEHTIDATFAGIKISEVRRFYGDGGPLFRNGFVLFHSGNIPSARSPIGLLLQSRFIHFVLNDFTVWYDPDCEVHSIKRGERSVLIVGDVYCNKGSSIDEILINLLDVSDPQQLCDFDLGGRYACFLQTKDRILVFNDPIGSRAISYLHDGRLAISSHSAILHHLFGCKINDNIGSQMNRPRYRERAVHYLPGDLTVFNNVYRLTPNHAYDSRVNGPVRYWPKDQVKFSSVDQLYESIDSALRALCQHISSRYQPVVSITGGVDSRAMISMLRRMTIPFSTMTWRDYNFSIKETDIVDEIASMLPGPHYDLRLKSLNDSACSLDPYSDDIISAAAAYNSGMVSETSNRALMLRRFCEYNKKEDVGKRYVFINGYGGEIIRGFYMKSGRAGLPFADSGKLLGLYGVGRPSLPVDSSFSRFVAQAFREFRARTQFTKIGLKGWNSYDLFYWEHRMGIWGAGTMDNIDVSMHCLAGFNSRDTFAKAITLPEDKRLSKKIIAEYVRSRDPDLGRVKYV
jgi:hypothetical protein